MNKADEPQYIVFVYEDGREERMNWQQFSGWQNDRLNAMVVEQMQRVLHALDHHATGQLELMKRDLGGQVTEH